MLACAVAVFALLGACEKNDAPESPSTPTVTVAKPTTRTLAGYIDLSGTVSADLVARVEGYLEEIHFLDGAHVDEG